MLVFLFFFLFVFLNLQMTKNMKNYAASKELRLVIATYNTVESCKFRVLGTRDFISKYRKFEL